MNESTFLTLKLSVFHARTFLNFLKKRNHPIVQLLNDFPNLSIQILCIGKHSGKVARENANKEQLNNAITHGMKDLYKLANEHKSQFEIRNTSDNIVDISLRTTILMEENKIIFCHFNFWKPGYERGIHGKTYNVDPQSSIALQINQLFDDAFRRAIPMKKNCGWIIYKLRCTFKIMLSILIVSFLNILVFNNSAFFNEKLTFLDFVETVTTALGTFSISYIINWFGKKLYEN